MTAHIQRRTFNIMKIFDGLKEYLNSGDPMVREWFLVKSSFWPIFLCIAYLFTVKVLGPAIMRDRKPIEFKKTLIAYNMFLTTAYATSVSIIMYCMWHTDKVLVCKNSVLSRENYTYTIVTCEWVFYLLKYLEFLDTVFSVLRKKEKQFPKFHVMHHAIVPIIGWFFIRTERSLFHVYPVILNCIVHMVMYLYYGLAAMGPSFRKYLWWSRYLILAHMIEFLMLILYFTILRPWGGCSAVTTSNYISIFASSLLFTLFIKYQFSSSPSLPPTAKFRKH